MCLFPRTPIVRSSAWTEPCSCTHDWQRPIPVDGGKFMGDVGLAGPDGGKGGKFLSQTLIVGAKNSGG